jgi:hypothetical protein
LKHLGGSVKRLQEAFGAGNEKAVSVALLDMLRNLEDFRVKLKRVALAGYWKIEQKNSGRTTVLLYARNS